ncbi:MAG: hypothetical protein AAFY19_11395 [Pseudomonadota bacterium]
MASVVLNVPYFVNVGTVSVRQSQIDALSEWANTMETKLLGLHFGQILPRDRHRAWAEAQIDDAQIVLSESGTSGLILVKSRLRDAGGAA